MLIHLDKEIKFAAHYNDGFLHINARLATDCQSLGKECYKLKIKIKKIITRFKSLGCHMIYVRLYSIPAFLTFLNIKLSDFISRKEAWYLSFHVMKNAMWTSFDNRSFFQHKVSPLFFFFFFFFFLFPVPTRQKREKENK